MRAFFGVSLTSLIFYVLLCASVQANTSNNTHRVLSKYFSDSSDPKIQLLLRLSAKGMLNIETSLTIKGEVANFSPNRYLNYLRGVNEVEDFLPVIFSPSHHINKKVERNLFSSNLIETDFLILKSLDTDESLECIGLRKFMIPWKLILDNWAETFLSTVEISENQLKLSESSVFKIKEEATINLFSNFVINVDISSEKIIFKPQVIYFAHNSYNVDLDYLDQNIQAEPFEESAKWLQHYLQLGCDSNELIHLIGHADRSGGPRALKYNQEISLKRAEAVKAELKSKISSNIESEDYNWLESLFIVEGLGVSESSTSLVEKNDFDRRVEIDIDPTLHEKEYIVLSQPTFKHSQFNITMEANEQYSAEQLKIEVDNTTTKVNSCSDSFERGDDKALCLALLVELEKISIEGDLQQIIVKAINSYHYSYLTYQFQRMNKTTCRLNEIVFYLDKIKITFIPSSRKRKKLVELEFSNYQGFSTNRDFKGNRALKEVDQHSSEFNPVEYYESSKTDAAAKFYDYPYNSKKTYLRIEIEEDAKFEPSKPIVSC